VSTLEVLEFLAGPRNMTSKTRRLSTLPTEEEALRDPAKQRLRVEMLECDAAELVRDINRALSLNDHDAFALYDERHRRVSLKLQRARALAAENEDQEPETLENRRHYVRR
jgi:hypothetical protein